MADESDDNREQGIEFGALIEALEDESYPLDNETLLSQHGDYEIGLFDDQVPLREVLSPEQDREYEDIESVKQAVFTMVGDEAVGRKNYTDRGGSHEEIGESTESDSF